MFQIWTLTWIKENTNGLHTIRSMYSDSDLAIQTMVQIQFQNQWKCNSEDHVTVSPESTLFSRYRKYVSLHYRTTQSIAPRQCTLSILYCFLLDPGMTWQWVVELVPCYLIHTFHCCWWEVKPAELQTECQIKWRRDT